MLAQRTMLSKSSRTAAAKAATDAGKEIIALTAGEIWADIAPTIRGSAIATINNGVNRYTGAK